MRLSGRQGGGRRLCRRESGSSGCDLHVCMVAGVGTVRFMKEHERPKRRIYRGIDSRESPTGLDRARLLLWSAWADEEIRAGYGRKRH